MPRIELCDGYTGICYRTDTIDPAKIGPWLGEMLTSDLIHSDQCCPAQVMLYPLPGEQLPVPAPVYQLTHEGRKMLVKDLAAVLGLELRGQLVKADGGVRAP